MDKLKPAYLSRSYTSPQRIVADYSDDGETQIAIIRPPTELYPDDDGAAVCAWAQRHVGLWLASYELLAAAKAVRTMLDDCAPGDWGDGARRRLDAAIAAAGARE